MRARIGILFVAASAIFALVKVVRYLLASWSRDEERPAMIVKGGSLIFQSGDELAGEGGLPWEQVGNGRWTPKQPRGKAVVTMLLTAKSGDDCDVKRLPVKDIKIRYFGTAVLESFQIRLLNGEPMLIGAGLSAGTSKSYPTVERPGSGSVFTLSYTEVDGATGQCDVKRARVEFTDQAFI